MTKQKTITVCGRNFSPVEHGDKTVTRWQHGMHLLSLWRHHDDGTWYAMANGGDHLDGIPGHASVCIMSGRHETPERALRELLVSVEHLRTQEAALRATLTELDFSEVAA